MRLQNNNIVKMIVFVIFFTIVYSLVAMDENNDVKLNTKTENYSFWDKESSIYIDFRQPDGVKVKIEIVFGGKNNPLTMHRKDGYTVAIDHDTRYFCWAKLAENGNLVSTGYPVHLYDPKELGLEKDIRMSDAAAKREYEREFDPVRKKLQN